METSCVIHFATARRPSTTAVSSARNQPAVAQTNPFTGSPSMGPASGLATVDVDDGTVRGFPNQHITFSKKFSILITTCSLTTGPPLMSACTTSRNILNSAKKLANMHRTTYTASLTSSVVDYPTEYGRRYHAFRQGGELLKTTLFSVSTNSRGTLLAYQFPNDDVGLLHYPFCWNHVL